MYRFTTAVLSLFFLMALGTGCASAPGDESDPVDVAQGPTVGAMDADGPVSTGNCTECDPQFKWVYEMYATFDTDLEACVNTYVEPDAVFRFANYPYVVGSGNVLAMFQSLVSHFDSMHHEVLAVWRRPGGVTVQGEAVIVRASDGETVTVPYLSVLTADHEKLSKALIYIDPTPLLQ